MQGGRPNEFVSDGALVRMDDGRFGHVRESVTGQEYFLRPLQILGDGRRSKRMRVPDRASDARAHVVKRAAFELRHRIEGVELLETRDADRPSGARGRLGAREVMACDGTGVRTGDLASEGAGESIVCKEGRGERRKPGKIIR